MNGTSPDGYISENQFEMKLKEIYSLFHRLVVTPYLIGPLRRIMTKPARTVYFFIFRLLQRIVRSKSLALAKEDLCKVQRSRLSELIEFGYSKFDIATIPGEQSEYIRRAIMVVNSKIDRDSYQRKNKKYLFSPKAR